MKKRILVLLSVVALMMGMLAISVAPAFAAPPTFQYTLTSTGETFFIQGAKFAHQFERSGAGTCERVRS
jgi:hypothetical protein